MSRFVYIAADEELETLANPYQQWLSINEAEKNGVDIPDHLKSDHIDRDKKIILYCDGNMLKNQDGLWLDAELDDDMSVQLIEHIPEDIYSEKPFLYSVEWNFCTEGRAGFLSDYLKRQATQHGELELWNVWLGLEVKPVIRTTAVSAESLSAHDIIRLMSYTPEDDYTTQYDIPVQHRLIIK